ncbi:MAG TPA: DNA recombination protein RmuC [Gaiellaceae bacterium]|jgi:DNA recombination protein RmuC|nr:DNA recombination protein RmuC [Gaiellaceae bacterium]
MTQLLFLVIGLAIGIGAALLWSRERIARAEEKTEHQAEWETRLKAATGDVLLKSQSSLLELTEAKLAPIKETLTKFEAQARQLEDKRTREVSAIGERLREVAEGQERLRTETGSLVTALRAPHVRGRWGEIQLKRVVELAGMLEHCDFRTQASERDDEGRILRPDLVVSLPGGKSIVVDSKVPIEAYLHAVNTDDADAKRAHLLRHAQQMREHIRKLGQKRYWDQFESTPEFVVMFVDEGLYRAALDQDSTLFEAGVEAGVIVASPATLIGLLRTISYGWQQETVAQSAREIKALGSELYKRLAVYADYFSKVGRGLDTAVNAYNQAVSSFESRLLVTARKFPEHGVTNDELPEMKQLERKPAAVTAPELVAIPHRDADAA